MRNRFESTSQRGRRRHHVLARFGAASCLAALSLIASASPAAASVTIGQVAPPSPPATCFGDATFDWVQPTVTSGNSYVVPVAGTITSWSTSATAGAGQTFKMKVWRLVSGSTYMAVGHEGPRALTGGVLNTFPASVPVKPGDVLGANNKRPPDSACVFSTPGEGPLASMTDLADGESGAFSGTGGGKRVNISAVVTPTPPPPSNEFEIGKLKGKKLTLTVPGPGEVEVSDAADTSASGASAAAKKKRLKPSSATASGAGEVTVKLRLTKSAKQKLKQRRKVKVNAAITFTPTGGTANTETAKLKVKKKK